MEYRIDMSTLGKGTVVLGEEFSMMPDTNFPTVSFVSHRIAVYHALWRELHTQLAPCDEWFDGWIRRVPDSDCGCFQWLVDWVAINKPRYDDWPQYGFELHNAVNAKLGKPLFSWSDFCSKWRPDLWAQQSPVSDFIAVTSLAPHRLDRQTVALDSWVRHGLKIVSVNTFAEFELIEKDYPQVSAWIHLESDCKTQRINSLLDVSKRWETPILLINSDIEVYGDQSRLIDLARAGKSAIGIRHNYDSQLRDAKQEMWGLDAFLVYPEQVEQFHRTDFAIGVPMWDWWLPWELHRVGAECEWIEEPFFFHKNHPQAWSEATCVQQKAYFAERFGSVDFIQWRQAKSFEGC